jgi:hypothetical protein
VAQKDQTSESRNSDRSRDNQKLKQQAPTLSIEANKAGAAEDNGTGDEDLPKAIAAINPKDLTNEELEYVIKTGKVPPKYIPLKVPKAPKLAPLGLSEDLKD